MQIHELNTFTGTPGDLDFLPLDNGFDTSKISATDFLKAKLNKPADNGQAGQLLRSKGDGGTEWSDVGLPTDAQTAQAVSDWLDAHPEATTTVQDGSLTIEKFALGTMGFITPEMFGAKGDGVTDDTVAIQDAINYAISTSAWLEGMNKQYMVSDAVVLPPELSNNEKGLYINGSLYMRNFRFVLKSDVSDLTSVLNIMTDPDDLTIIENVTINGNGTNQTQVTTPIQDGGLHGMRIGLTGMSAGHVIITSCNIFNCYSDGLCIRSATFDQLIVEKTIITANGRNGITDNAFSSLIDSCIIKYNGTRTAPKSGYHIEPDTSFNFGIKQLINCEIVDNVADDIKVHFNTYTYNLDKLEIESCVVGIMGWANYGQSISIIKEIKCSNTIFNGRFEYTINSFSVLTHFERMLFDNCRFNDYVSVNGAGDNTNLVPRLIFEKCVFTHYVLLYKTFDCVTFDGCYFYRDPVASADTQSTYAIYIDAYTSDSNTKIINNFDLRNCQFYGTSRAIEGRTSYIVINKLSIINNFFYNLYTVYRNFGQAKTIFVLNNLINVFAPSTTVATIQAGTCNNFIASNNVSNKTEGLTFNVSNVTNAIKDNNIYSATL